MIQQKWGFYQHIWAFKSNWLHILEPGFCFFLGLSESQTECNGIQWFDTDVGEHM